MLSGAEVEVPIMDDLAAFTGDFVLDTDRAWDLVHDFTQTRAAGLWVSGVSCSERLMTRSRPVLVQPPPADEAAGQ